MILVNLVSKIQSKLREMTYATICKKDIMNENVYLKNGFRYICKEICCINLLKLNDIIF